MAYNNEQVQDLFNLAADRGYRIVVKGDGIVDYGGYDTADALDAVLELGEADVYFYERNDRMGYAYILPDLDEGEQISDCSGWVSVWMDER